SCAYARLSTSFCHSFCYSYGVHRDLHSFPTRRSSDLATGEITYWSEEAFRLWGFDPGEGLPRFEERQRRFHPDDRARATEHFRTDRKSTRLNSSHGSISYAVFCLKKKNKDQEDKKYLR